MVKSVSESAGGLVVWSGVGSNSGVVGSCWVCCEADAPCAMLLPAVLLPGWVEVLADGDLGFGAVVSGVAVPGGGW